MKNAEAIETLRANYPDACFEQLREAVDAAIEALKAQHSQEGTTSDLISRTETVERLRGVFEITVPITDHDGGYIDGIETGISIVSTMPTIQPVATDTNVGNNSVIPNSSDAVSRQAAIDVIEDYPHGNMWNVESMGEMVDKNKTLPTAQPEPKEGHWIWVAGELMCSKCRTIYSDLYPDYDNAVACPHCGARMKGE